MPTIELSVKLFADVKVCNCAWCNLLLLGKAEWDYLHENPERYQMVAGAVDDRPYCAECLPLIRSERGHDEAELADEPELLPVPSITAASLSPWVQEEQSSCRVSGGLA